MFSHSASILCCSMSSGFEPDASVSSTSETESASKTYSFFRSMSRYISTERTGCCCIIASSELSSGIPSYFFECFGVVYSELDYEPSFAWVQSFGKMRFVCSCSFYITIPACFVFFFMVPSSTIGFDTNGVARESKNSYSFWSKHSNKLSIYCSATSVLVLMPLRLRTSSSWLSFCLTFLSGPRLKAPSFFLAFLAFYSFALEFICFVN